MWLLFRVVTVTSVILIMVVIVDGYSFPQWVILNFCFATLSPVL